MCGSIKDMYTKKNIILKQKINFKNSNNNEQTKIKNENLIVITMQ